MIKVLYKIFLLSIMIFFHNAFGQKLANGVYVGYEQNPFCYNKECFRNYKENSLKRNELSYKITLLINDSVTTMTKLPVKYIRRRKVIVDSANGGFYTYKNIEITNNYISGRLSDCKYCQKGGSSVMKYTRLYYKVHQTRSGLVISNYSNDNIFLKKVR